MHSFQLKAPARLHLGFLDISGTLGRRFGSLGMAIASHHLVLSVTPSDVLSTHLPSSHHDSALKTRIEGLIDRFFAHYGAQIKHTTTHPRIHFEELIPEHAGLGSGTQLAITLGQALATFYQIKTSTVDIAHALGRGNRSGIGISTFDTGGFVVDAGLAEDSTVPAQITRMNYPDKWRVVMLLDHAHQGVHGEQEKTAFRELPPFPKQHSQTICHLTLMQLLPALVEQKIEAFGAAVTQIQALIGDHFAPYQGGQFSSPQIASLLQFAHDTGHQGIAQSSWGPTGCVFVESDQQANKLKAQLEANIQASGIDGIEIIIAQAQNHGAEFQNTSFLSGENHG